MPKTQTATKPKTKTRKYLLVHLALDTNAEDTKYLLKHYDAFMREGADEWLRRSSLYLYVTALRRLLYDVRVVPARPEKIALPVEAVKVRGRKRRTPAQRGADNALN